MKSKGGEGGGDMGREGLRGENGEEDRIYIRICRAHGIGTPSGCLMPCHLSAATSGITNTCPTPGGLGWVLLPHMCCMAGQR